MRRRDFITLAGGTAAAWPLTARAENGGGVRRVGVIMGFAEHDEVWQAYLANFRQGLQELGWTDGRNIRFDYRFTGESEERMRAMAEEVVALQPDVILVSTNSVVSATLKTTRSIPIVFTWVSDPQKGQPLSADGWLEIVEAGDVSAGMGQVGNKSASDRIGHPGEDDRNGARGFQGCRNDRIG